MARSVRRKSTPLSPAKQRATTTSPRQTRNSKRTLSREPEQRETRQKQQVHLESVDEHEDTIVVNTGLPSAEPNTTIGNALHGSFGSMEHTDDESENDDLSDLDRDDIIDHLDDIERYSQKLLETFKSGPVFDVIHMLNDAKSRKAKNFQQQLTRLAGDLAPCGRGSMIFCPMFRVLHTFSDRSIPAGLGAVFLKANTAILVSKLAEIKDKDHMSRSELLQALNTANGFPNLFFDFINGTYLIDEDFGVQTADVAIAVLVQYFIDTVENTMDKQALDTTTLLEKIFLDAELRPRSLSFGIRSNEAEDAIRGKLTEVIDDIQKHLPRKSRPKFDLTNLKKRYPWAFMVEQLVTWAKDVHERLDTRIGAGGGILAMISSLEQNSTLEIPDSAPEDEVELTESLEGARALREGVSWAHDIDEELDTHYKEADESELEDDVDAEDNREDVSSVKRIGLERRDNAEAVSSIRMAAPRRDQKPHVVRQSPVHVEDPPRSLTPQPDLEREEAISDEHTRNADEEDGPEIPEPQDLPQEPEIRPTQEVQNILNMVRSQERDSDKENNPATRRYRLLERQPGAVRVQFDTDESQQLPRGSGKRTRQQSESEGEEDDYETIRRPDKRPRPDKGKRIARSPAEERGSPFFVPDSEQPEEQNEVPQSSGRQVLGELRRPFSQPGPSSAPSRARNTTDYDRESSQDSDRRSTAASRPPPSSYADAHEEIRQMAARNVQRAALVTTAEHPVRIPQIRRSWEKEEIECLWFWMEKFGPVWAKIKEADSESRRPKLENRTQVQLKDKARNMKLDYLKAEQPLPWFLESVTISQRHKEDLRKRGIAIPEARRRVNDDE